MGWDKKSGSPTDAAYHRLGLGDVADALKKQGTYAVGGNMNQEEGDSV